MTSLKTLSQTYPKIFLESVGKNSTPLVPTDVATSGGS